MEEQVQSLKTIWDFLNQPWLYTILGSIISFLGIFFANRYQKKKELLEKKKDLLEILYVDMTKWYNSFLSTYIFFTPVIEKAYDWNTYFDNVSSKEKNNKQTESEMKICLYFPELKKFYDKLINEVQNTYVYIDVEIKAAYCRNEDLSEFKRPLYLKMENTNKTFEDFKQEMLRIANKIH